MTAGPAPDDPGPTAPRRLGRSEAPSVDPDRWAGARRILAVRLDAIGDVLMTTPALRALRRSSSGRTVTLLTSPAGAEIAEMIPEIDEVVPYEAPWMKAPQAADPRRDHGMIERLRRGAFDAAAIFTVFSQSALPAAVLCHLAGIPLRLAHLRENPYHLLTDWVPDPELDRPLRHEVRRQLDLVAAVGCRTDDERLSLRTRPEDREAAAAVLTELGVETGERWALVHPGASAPSRRYPWEGYAAAAGVLAADHGWRLVFTGTAEEAELVERIRDRVPAPTASLAGRLGVAALAAVIERAPLLISNNTGPVHIAAAVGTPVVDLYALTNTQHTPWMVASEVLSHDVPCKNCLKSVCPEVHHNCLRLVSPEDVVSAAVRLQPGPARTA